MTEMTDDELRSELTRLLGLGSIERGLELHACFLRRSNKSMHRSARRVAACSTSLYEIETTPNHFGAIGLRRWRLCPIHFANPGTVQSHSRRHEQPRHQARQRLWNSGHAPEHGDLAASG